MTGTSARNSDGPTFSWWAILYREATADGSVVLSFYSLVAFCGVQDAGTVSPPGAIARHKQSSLFCSIGCKQAFTMRSLDHCRIAHAIHQWLEDGHMDREPKDTTATEMEFGGCSSVGARRDFPPQPSGEAIDC